MSSPHADVPIAQLEGVSHRYRAVQALDAVSLEIPGSRLAGLIGPDGVGKSTLLGLVAGVRRLQVGRVRALGGDLGSSRHRRRVGPDIAYMAQGLGTNLYPDLSVAENVRFFARLFGLGPNEREDRVHELLVATGLEPFRDRRVRQLSGGMKQKLGLCCALVHDPRLLVLDEPTTGVDPLSRRQFWQLVERMRDRRPGMSVLVSTAYMEEAERFDWLAVMDRGQVLATGSPSDVQRLAGTDSLTSAYLALLPDSDGSDARLSVPPRRSRSEVAIEAQGLTRCFGDFVAVDDVSFKIERGEIFGFVGSNGCGKTTTMKILTGLLPASGGEARLFGRRLEPRDLETRRRVGYMTQSFSLYRELSVRQNLELHARLYGLDGAEAGRRADESLDRFDLTGVAESRAQALPLGVRQRLSLAVALIHGPPLLILDEPTSGVDPVARDRFWAQLLRLSREDGVTIFLSTHFMDEAARCDRIALMHAGRVLATGPPAEIVRARGVPSLEDAFVDVIREAEPAAGSIPASRREAGAPARPAAPRRRFGWFDPRRALAVAGRESREIARDRIRLAFALLGPLLLLVVCGYGISFDVEGLRFAALDLDASPESRRYLEGFRGSRYFLEQAPLTGSEDLDLRLASGDLALAIEIPPDFGRQLWRGAHPEVGIWLDGAMPFTAETSRGYVEGVHARTTAELLREAGRPRPSAPVRLEYRYRYNQDFESLYAIVPGVFMLVLIMVPSIMTAVGVVREKELGSIVNVYVTPTTRLEFLLGKQLPYVVVGLAGFAVMLVVTVFLFRVPVGGSLAALVLGAFFYLLATTGFGLVVSTFVRSQLAAIFATSILTMLPASQFSGLLAPVSSLSGGARVLGLGFPSSWFQQVSLGVFSKDLSAADLLQPYAMMVGFSILYLVLAGTLLRKQEA